MTFDDQLRAELDALERSAPVATPPAAIPPRGLSKWVRPAAVVATATAAVVFAALLMGQLPERSTGDASGSADAGVMAQDANGDFVLTLSSPRSSWDAGEAIEITATLTYRGDQPSVSIGGGAGPVVFSLRQLQGGNAEMGGGQDLPCLQYALGPDAPLVWPFIKSGTHEAAPFNREFFEDPVLRLPPGLWEVRVWLQYGVATCDDLMLEATIEIEVVGIRPPSASPTPPSTSCMTGLAHGVLGADDQGHPTLTVAGQEQPVRIAFPDGVEVDAGPPLTIRNPAGDVWAREGDWIELGGGFSADDSVFHACGLGPVGRLDPGGAEIIDCQLGTAADCEAALLAAYQLLQDEETYPRKLVVGWGRGLAWHAEVHACWADGRRILIDVIGSFDPPLAADAPGGLGPSDIRDLTASIREDPSDRPQCD